MRLAPLVFAVPGLVGCELAEVSLTEPESILVAEVYVMVWDGDDQITAFLHWTLGLRDTPGLSGSSVRLTTEEGTILELRPQERDVCVLPEVSLDIEGACFALPVRSSSPEPGSEVEVEIVTPGGATLRGTTVIPEAFDIVQPVGLGACVLPPSNPLEIQWTRSMGAWAYGAEAQIWGLRAALAGQGIEVESDTVALLGLAISDSDTTVVFPGEFGVFSRFELDRDLALALQEGMPLGAIADVTVGALDRNYVNWVRGGSFNPSGAVRVPSLRGDGTGVVAAVYRRSFRILGSTFDPGVGSCLPSSGEAGPSPGPSPGPGIPSRP